MCTPFIFAEANNVSLTKEYLSTEKSCVSKKINSEKILKQEK